MNELALFAGAGGGILGGRLLGWRTICGVEIDKFCRDRIMQRQDEGHIEAFPIWDDVNTFDGSRWRGLVDLVSGGFPCQAFSSATRGRATAESMWPQMLRVVGEVQPRFVFAENVSEDAICEAQADLADCGYATARVCIRATDLGADHPRRRWWLLADADHESELVGPEYAEMERVAERGARLWEAEPYDPGVDDGMAGRVDRYRAIGNGQLPTMVVAAWCALTSKLADEGGEHGSQGTNGEG